MGLYSKRYREEVEKLKKAQYIDDKELFVYANIVNCPFGVWGHSFISVKGENLYVFGADFHGPKGEPIFIIPIKEMKDIKFPHGFFATFFKTKFTYNGHKFVFQSGFNRKYPICKAIIEINSEI